MTRWKRLKRWFWVTKAGMALNILLGHPVAFRIKVIKGTLTVEDGERTVLRDCYVEV